MARIPWVPLRILQIVLSRKLNGRSIWEWHHHQMTTDPPYARLFIQGVVKALWKESFDKAVVRLLKTAAEIARYLKQGDLPLE